MQKCIPLSEIKSSPIVRDGTGIPELDFIYGYSCFSNFTLWGLPEGKISLWAAESGTGKSRLAIEVVKNMSRIYSNSKILYFQTEAEIEDFAGWVPDSSQYRNVLCSGEDGIEAMIDMIYQVRPKVVFVDSVNEMSDFESGNKKEARRLIHGVIGKDKKMIKPGVRKVCQDVGCHLIFLGQLNQNGTIKGGTSLPHLVDIALDLTKCDINNKGGFDVKIGTKHRHGRKEKHICGKWLHTEAGVESVSSNRDCDKIWCKLHNQIPLTRIVHKSGEVLSPSDAAAMESLAIDSDLSSGQEFLDIISDPVRSKEFADSMVNKFAAKEAERVAKQKGNLLALPLLGLKNLVLGR